MSEKRMLYRSVQIDTRAVKKEDGRTVELTFSSEEPVERYWRGEIVWEVLDHSPESVDMARLAAGAPLLKDHDPGLHIGIIEQASIGTDRKGRAKVRFGKGALASEVFEDVADGIRPNVSVGYAITGGRVDGEKDGQPILRVTWQPMEISSVAMPADITVGVGRDNSAAEIVCEAIEAPAPEERGEAAATPEAGQTSEAEQVPDTNTNSQEGERTMPEIDVNAEREAARKEEQARVRSILAAAKLHNQAELGAQFVENGRSVEEFHAAILERYGAKPVTQTAEIGMTGKEVKRYSLFRAVQALLTGDWSKAGLEREASQAVAAVSRRDARGFFLPYDVLNQKRDVTSTTAAGLIATDHLDGEFIGLLRAQSMVTKLGARVLDGLVGDVAIPKQTGGAAAYWIDNETGATTKSDVPVGSVGLTPHTVSARVDITRKMLLQSSPSVEAMVRADLIAALSGAIDIAAINGSGADGQPLGLLGMVGIGSVVDAGGNGSVPDFADVRALWAAVANANAGGPGAAFLTNSAMIGTLMGVQKADGTGQFLVPGFPDAEGFTVLAGGKCAMSNNVPADLTAGTATDICSALIYGNFADLLIGAWGQLDVSVDDKTNADAGGLVLRGFSDVDVKARNVASFSAKKDCLVG